MRVESFYINLGRVNLAVFSKSKQPVPKKSSANLPISDVGGEDVAVTSEIDGRVDRDLVKSTNIVDLELSEEGVGRLEQLLRERGSAVSLHTHMTVEQAAVTVDRQDAVMRNIILLKVKIK